MAEIEIQGAPIALKDRITALCRQTYNEHRSAQPFAWAANYFELAIKPHLDAAFQDKRGKQLKESPTLFAAMKDGQFAGYLRLANWSTGMGGDLRSGSIEDICVIPEYRGQGVARALISHALDLAEQHGWDNLNAHVSEWNAASKSLFETSGFTLQSRTYRFGPDKQAQDYPTASANYSVSPLSWLWIALTVVNLTAIIVFLLRQ